MSTKTIRLINKQNINQLQDKVQTSVKSNILSINFSKFQFNPICLNGKFNNHFKDDTQLSKLLSEFLGVILPKVSSQTYTGLQRESKQLHFHTIDNEHLKIVRDILISYNFSEFDVSQMFEGNNLCEFSASLGHIVPARVVCHKVDDILYLLFLDVNHHIYINRKYVKESMFYEHCPSFLENNCPYMPDDCFAVEYLDDEKFENSFR